MDPCTSPVHPHVVLRARLARATRSGKQHAPRLQSDATTAPAAPSAAERNHRAAHTLPRPAPGHPAHRHVSTYLPSPTPALCSTCAAAAVPPRPPARPPGV